MGVVRADCAGAVVPEEPHCFCKLTEMPVCEPSPAGCGREGQELRRRCALEWTQRLTEQLHGRVWSPGPRRGSLMAHCCPYYTPPHHHHPGHSTCWSLEPVTGWPG